MLFKKLFLLMILLLVCMSFASANDLNDINSTDYDDLVKKIETVHENQTLELEKDYNLTGTTQKHVIIEKSLTVDGRNHTIDAGDCDRVFWVKADNVIIKNINFINSKSTSLAGGAISWWGNNGTLLDCSFSNNSASSAGGAVLWKGNDGLIKSCSFENNRVNYGKAVTLVDGEGFDPSMIHIQVVNSEGGAIYVSGNDVIIDSCMFTDNHALLNGGAISINWPNNVTISNSKFKNNKAQYNGAAIDLNSNAALIINSTFSANSPIDLFNNCRNTTIISSVFAGKSSIDTWYDINYVNVTFKDFGYFEDLAILVNNTPSGGVLVLDKDYEFANGSNKGILISKPITIDGTGHTLDGKELSRMFNITSDDVVLRNINFINGNAYGRYDGIAGGGAIYWSGNNGILENCNFTNNAGRGIEDDPFDKEETYVTEDGMIIHTIRMRPMGAKINEGGAIVWNGTNGTVFKCIFTRNSVGYPNTGGAICWRGNNGKVLGSEFYFNNAWCGSAIAWIGDNGLISKSVIANSTFFDGGIYWFGKNGTVQYSILLGVEYNSALRPGDADVTADYNFWGDTLENPNKSLKAVNLSNWLVMKFTHNGEFVVKGQKVIIGYDITNLMDKDGNIVSCDVLIDKSGQIVYTAEKSGFLNITFENCNIKVKVDAREHIVSGDVTKYYCAKTSFKVSVYDFSGKVVNKYVTFKVNKNTHKVKTDKNGVATLKLKLKPGKYTVYASYGDVKVKNKIKVKNALITKNLSKKVKKAAKFKVKVLNSKGKAYKKQVVKIKFRGKTYKVKTNKKGIATFKIPKKLKVGKYTIKTTWNGLTNSNKITVKK